MRKISNSDLGKRVAGVSPPSFSLRWNVQQSYLCLVARLGLARKLATINGLLGWLGSLSSRRSSIENHLVVCIKLAIHTWILASSIRGYTLDPRLSLLPA